jgi:hypothetical protein
VLCETHRFLAERAGYAAPLLSIDEFVRELEASRRRLSSSGTHALRIRHVLQDGDRHEPSLCLPNPGYRPPPPAVVAKPRRQLATTLAAAGVTARSSQIRAVGLNRTPWTDVGGHREKCLGYRSHQGTAKVTLSGIGECRSADHPGAHGQHDHLSAIPSAQLPADPRKMRFHRQRR